MINLDELRAILDLVRDHALGELEIESEGFRIRVRKGDQVTLGSAPAPAAPHPSGGQAGAADAGPVPPPADGATTSLGMDTELAFVTSPIVGTFYRSPEPNAPAFAQPGDRVKQGQTLCIIEAMKMMNNIDSEYRWDPGQGLRRERPACAVRRAALRHQARVSRRGLCSRRS